MSNREMLSYLELIDLVENNIVENSCIDHINAASIDVTLGKTVIVEKRPAERRVIDVAKKETFASETFDLDESGIELEPGEFILAHTVEKFNLPNNLTAHFKLKSSGARAGLDNALATWCDPGWNGSVLTLELKNNLRYGVLKLTPGMKIGQMIFERVKEVPENASYAVKGRYNGDSSVQHAKADKEALVA